jgi:hypothetical protein
MNEDKARQIVHVGEQLEALLENPGFQYVLDNYIAKGLDRQRFLGCRIGKLVWMQGFQAGLDGLLKFIDRAIQEKNEVVQDVAVRP